VPQPLFTIGHSDHTFDEFGRMLRENGIRTIVDVRKLTGSRKHPQFNDDALEETLPAFGAEYRRIEELGGRRNRSRTVDASVNAMWRNQSFHNYADWALSDEFRNGINRLLTWGEQAPTAVMCSEAVWWRCHRRIIADHLLARGESVFHILSATRTDAASLTPGAVTAPDGEVTYPAQDT